MSGGIYFVDRSYWGAASWLFESVLESLAFLCGDESAVADEIHTVLRTNVGVLDLSTLDATGRLSLAQAMSQGLLGDLPKRLPSVGIDIEGAMAVASRLVDLADAQLSGGALG